MTTVTVGGNDAAQSAEPIFEQYPIAHWVVGAQFDYVFPVESINESGGNRIVERERPYRDGAKLDDTGSKAKRWSVVVFFDNGIEEEGLDNGGLPLYPDVLNQMLASFDLHETGTLTLPTRGPVRVRADTYVRDENKDDRDSAKVTFTFVHDNEDSIGSASFELPTVNASARTMGEQTLFSATSEGVFSGDLQSLREFASDLQAYAEFPDSFVSSIDEQCAQVLYAVDLVVDTGIREDKENQEKLRDPELSRTQRNLVDLQDSTGRLKAQAQRGLPQPVSKVVDHNADIFAIAADLAQLPADLIKLNPGIDPLFIPAGSVIQVYE